VISDKLLKALTDDGSLSKQEALGVFCIGTMVDVLKHWWTTDRERERLKMSGLRTSFAHVLRTRNAVWTCGLADIPLPE